MVWTTTRNKMRDVSYMKPEGFQDHVTITELALLIQRDVSRIRQLEREGRIPVAARKKLGKNTVRLWSPAQVDEIRLIIAQMRPGRPRK